MNAHLQAIKVKKSNSTVLMPAKRYLIKDGVPMLLMSQINLHSLFYIEQPLARPKVVNCLFQPAVNGGNRHPV